MEESGRFPGWPRRSMLAPAVRFSRPDSRGFHHARVLQCPGQCVRDRSMSSVHRTAGLGRPAAQLAYLGTLGSASHRARHRSSGCRELTGRSCSHSSRFPAATFLPRQVIAPCLLSAFSPCQRLVGLPFASPADWSLSRGTYSLRPGLDLPRPYGPEFGKKAPSTHPHSCPPTTPATYPGPSPQLVPCVLIPNRCAIPRPRPIDIPHSPWYTSALVPGF